MKFSLSFILLMSSLNVFGAGLIGRMGLGMSNQLGPDFGAISAKMQSTPSFAMSGLAGFKSTSLGAQYGVAGKIFQIIYDEPQLTFYMAGLFGMVKKEIAGELKSGFQADGTLGSEFHFQGLESLGFSLEYGLSYSSAGGTTIQTVANHLLISAVHFYF